jgi:hypothetical protein
MFETGRNLIQNHSYVKTINCSGNLISRHKSGNLVHIPAFSASLAIKINGLDMLIMYNTDTGLR